MSEIQVSAGLGPSEGTSEDPFIPCFFATPGGFAGNLCCFLTYRSITLISDSVFMFKFPP